LGFPTSVVLDGAGNVYVTDLYSNRVFKMATTGNVTVVAGNGARGGISGGNGGPAISASLSYLTGVAVDSSGNIFIAERSNCRIRKVSAQTGNISTVAGTGTCFYFGDGVPATSAALNDPSGVAVDGSGNLFIADTWNCLVREVSASTGVISTLAGTPPDPTGLLHCGYSGDGGPAISAKVGFSNGVAVDGSGTVFIADPSSCVIRRISTSTGIISTVAGTGSCGYSGDGGPGTSATVNAPNGVAVDHSGNVFIADTSNCVIRKVASSNGQIVTVAGDFSVGCGYSGDGGLATSAQINQPYGVAVDSSGNFFIADYKNSVIREVSSSTASISTFAGVTVPDPNLNGHLIGLPALSGDGYLATDGELGFLNDTPYGAGMATDSSGNVYIADTANNAIRKISAATGIMTTVAGNGLIGHSGDGGPATQAELFYPRDVAVDSAGNIYIMDSGNCVVRKITASTGVISTVAGTLPDNSGGFNNCDFSGDGGPATSAQLYPIDLLIPAGGIAVDRSGNIFIADTGNGVIRAVSASTGIITTVAGIPLSLFVGTGDGGPATSATLFAPYGVAVDRSGNIFIADTDDYAIREVMAVNGNIFTIAGNIALGQGFSGDGGPAGSAQLRNVFGGLFLDSAGNLFIPDPANCLIRRVSGSTGIISSVAGTFNRNGTYFCGFSGDGRPALSATFDNPSATGAGASGDLVVLDGIRVRSVAGLVEGPAAAAVAFPNPLAFPSEALGTSSTLTVMLSDRGSLPTSVSTVVISGTNASDFSETDNCAGHSVAGGGGSCAISVKFTPSVAGTEIALLTITDTAGTQSVSLSGTGVVAPGFLPSVSTIAFGSQQKTVKSSATTITVTNNGAVGLTISAVGVSGPNAGDFATIANSCSGATVAANATCSVSVTFTPSTTSVETALLQFTDNAASSPQSISLSGTGTDFSIDLAAGGSATAAVHAGSPATYSLQVTPISGFNGTVALSCTGAPPESTCMPSESSATSNGITAAMFSVQVTTKVSSIAPPVVEPRWRPFDGLRLLPMVLLVALAAMLLAFASRFQAAVARQRRAYACGVSLCFLLFAIILIGCGGGSNSSPAPPPSGGTPVGNYTLTITGSSKGVSHSQTLTLTVN
jgi:sugar lactone lactonase YvrE